MSAHDMVDHVCVADHCVACCPVAKSYSNGFESAREFYADLGKVNHAEDKAALLLRGFLVGLALAAALYFIQRGSHGENTK